MLTRGLATLALAVGATGAVAPKTGTFAGSTKQGSSFHVGFRVGSGHVHGFGIGWRAPCASHKRLTDATGQGTQVLAIHNGTFAGPKGTFTVTIPHSSGLRGRYTVLLLAGHFSDARHAQGAFHLHAQILRNGQVVDTCDTGRVTWSAHSSG